MLGRIDAFLSALVAVGALVRGGAHCSQAVLFVRATQQGEEHRDKAVAIRPAQCEHPESSAIAVGVVVMDADQKLNALAAVTDTGCRRR